MLAVALGREDIEYGEPITRDKLDSEAVEMYCRVRDLEASGEWTDHPARLWMFLALDWLYLHRDRPATELAPGKTARDFGVEDNYPLGVVAMVWADFWYPSEISDLVHYMPVEKGVEVGEAALLDRWSEYLLRVSAEFSNR